MKIIDIPQTALDLISLRIGGNERWADPEELVVDLKPVAPFDPNLLPDVLRDFVMDISHRMQAPPDFVAVSCIVTIGAVIGSGCAVRPKQEDDWSEVANLWGGAIGGPSTMKTPSISAGGEPLRWLEAEARDEYNAAMTCYLLEKTDREFELKILKSDKGHTKLGLTVEEAQTRLRELTRSQLKEPTLRRFKTNDATVEMLGEILRDNPRGLLLIRDELVGLLATCSRQGHEGDRPFYLEAWNGQHSFAVDRIGRGSIIIPRLCLSIFGGIQPAKLQDYITATVDGFDNDGLLQRFQLMVYPDVINDWQYVDELPDIDARDKVISIARTLAATDFVRFGAAQEGDKPPYFRFCPSAQKEFIKWLTGLEIKIRRIDSTIMAEHLSKYRKLIPALALIFHLVDIANGKKYKKPGISNEALQRAIRWGVYLESHSERIYALALDPVVNCVNALAAKVKSGDLSDGFSERDVYKSGWSGLQDADLVHAACSELEQAGWIRLIEVPRGNGRPPSPSYLINPMLKGK